MLLVLSALAMMSAQASTLSSETDPTLSRPFSGDSIPTQTPHSVGIDIPDYIANGGKADALKHMSDKMKAMGRRRK
ncbi:hypothetical protein TCAL_16901 [Tigriopus californicus]|uniref:Uncharacterized protein n=1 Tax=Tigriopus californicus TaxID=6832 RepID=A0A553P8A6_TIGCA|nr:hypothetical protein TCAL_16901 [Tigriopus californicus]